MTLPTSFLSTLAVNPAATVGVILAAMTVIAAIEVLVPLHARALSNRTHLGPNLTLTFITFATNAFFGAGLVVTLVWLQAHGLGLLNMLALPPLVSGAIALVALDFSTYVTHVAMHKVPFLWRFHSVHHSDPSVDVTTTLRQHPGEGVIRYTFMAAFAFGLGASPIAFAIYRLWSALNALLEHANVRMPLWLDSGLSLVTTWPHMHKIHHSRAAKETDTNYGNIFSFFDRLFFTFTPSERGVNIVYGLEGCDDAATQTTAGLLALPFRDVNASGAAAVAVYQAC